LAAAGCAPASLRGGGWSGGLDTRAAEDIHDVTDGGGEAGVGELEFVDGLVEAGEQGGFLLCLATFQGGGDIGLQVFEPAALFVIQLLDIVELGVDLLVQGFEFIAQVIVHGGLLEGE
jgi:hypothetical protein